MLSTTIHRCVFASITSCDGVSFASYDREIEETFPTDSVTGPRHKDLRLQHAAYEHIMRIYNGGEKLPMKIGTHSNVAIGSGLGSSSAITVAIVRCFDEVLGLGLDNAGTASLAYRIERDYLGLKGGRQDHYSASFGGMNLIEFNKDGTVDVSPVRMSKEAKAELEHWMVMYFTGLSRESANIIQEQIGKISGDDGKTIDLLHRIKDIVYRMKEAMEGGDIGSLAELLHESWLLKRETSSRVSTPMIDRLYESALEAGALGGKISGAGGGGYMTLVCNPEKRVKVLKALPDSGAQDCNCAFDNNGTVSWWARG